MSSLHRLSALLGFAALTCAAVYAVLALLAMVIWRLRRRPAQAAVAAPVTILKPLCGAEPGLYRNLRSFCAQDYALFQVVFGVRDPTDPALAVVQQLQQEFPNLPIEVVIDSRQHGTNRKVSTLINMLQRARHDLLVIADSDACVARDYLGSVIAPLADPKVGLVTCLYRGVPTRSIWSRLGAMYINEWYIPSVLVAWLFGHRSYVSGQTLCMRRDTLKAIGGLQAIADYLADDYQLGELVRAAGQRIVLSPYLLQAEHDEARFELLAQHELRWMRTIAVLRPRSFRFLFFTFSLPMAILGAACAIAAGFQPAAAWSLLEVTLVVRILLHLVYRLRDGGLLLADLWLLPLRDLLLCWVWVRSFSTSTVLWRGNEFAVGPDGILRKLS
ncbi:MAG TPA: bacteriohopanetetrol glucosamine biosynthesis glycosyltransferase HpnI [Steroidobacteraceae bacterium]